MRVELISVWYNEAFLAPFFFNHYSWVDRIHILLDADTDDDTEEIAARYPNVSLERFTFPDMMDDLIKSRKINEKYQSIKDTDYVIVVDSDEFIACHRITDDIRDYLAATNKDLYFSVLWQTYQQESDIALDASKPPLLQRRNGDPVIANANIKPTIAKTGLDLVWGVGNHAVVFSGAHMSWLTPNRDAMAAHNVGVASAEILQGAHWRLFDLDEVVIRRTRNRSKRQSLVNLSANLSSHLHQTSAEDIRAEFERMKNSPLVIKDRQPLVGEALSTATVSIFDTLLADSAFTDGCPANLPMHGAGQRYESCAVPDWYASVKPLSSQEAMAEEMFLLACTYRKQGQPTKALALLQKAQLLAPYSEHYQFYLQQWHNELPEHP